MRFTTSSTAAALAAALLLAACGPGSPPPALDAAERTRVVGKHEDCTLFRTNPSSGPDITWVRCKKDPKVVEANHTESCGKGCTRHVKTITLEENDK